MRFQKRIKILQDLQLYLMEQMYYVPSGWGAFPTIVALQANIRGYKDHLSLGYGAQGQDLTYYWKA